MKEALSTLALALETARNLFPNASRIFVTVDDLTLDQQIEESEREHGIWIPSTK